MSNHKKRNNKGNSQVILSFRMNIIFISIFILFSILIFRLGYLQIVKGEDYVREVKGTEDVAVNTSTPRGRVYDRYGRILVDNEPQNAITYTITSSTTQNEILQVAKKLAKLIDMTTNRVTLRDKQDYWILNNTEKAYAKVSKKEEEKIREKTENEKERQSEIDQLVRERITDEELSELTQFDLEVLAIYREMSSGYKLTSQIIKNENVTTEEFARVSENLYELPGVNTTTDWKRVKFTSLALLGRTTVPSQGIPKSQLNYYLARDYSRNDRVGDSYFEAQYEELLQGKKLIVKNIMNKQGEVIDTVTTFKGEPGKDLVMTIDTELQSEAEKIVEKYLLQLKSKGGSSLLDRAFYVMMNPNTGEILAMVGKKIETDSKTGKTNVVDYSYGTFTTAYEVGSTVKAATLITGYKEGAVKPYTVLVDQPIKLAGANAKSSIFNRNSSISMNDLTALEQSSNSYMFQVALKIAGLNYYYDMGLMLDEDTLQKMRNGYAEFGLGVKTEIDLPNEFSGFQGELDTPGKILDLAIGQFDTYTPLQLVQYISTVANGGYRVQPRFLKEIREPSTDGKTLGPLIEEVQPKILNILANPEEEINHVKQGLRRVYSNGTASTVFANAPYTAAGKTGTAEVVYYGPQKEMYGTNTIDLTHVGFAPYENPEVAYAVVIPWVTTNLNAHLGQNNEIAREVLDVYFELKKKNAKSEISDQVVNKKITNLTTDEKIDENDKEQIVND